MSGQELLTFLTSFISLVALLWTVTPKGFRQMLLFARWFKRNTLQDIYDRLDALETKIQ